MSNTTNTATASYGYLYEYSSGRAIRHATAEERDDSEAAAEFDGGAGVITVDGNAVYVQD